MSQTNNRYLQIIAEGIGAGTTNSFELRNAGTDDRALISASGGTPTFGLASLPVVANAASPTLTEAKIAYLSSDLLGNVRVLTTSRQYSTVSTATPATADATVFTLAAGEKGFIQNLSADAPLAYKLGASASTSSFNGVMSCGVAADDGKGDSVVIDDFIGAISVAKISGTARYVAYKLS